MKVQAIAMYDIREDAFLQKKQQKPELASQIRSCNSQRSGHIQLRHQTGSTGGSASYNAAARGALSLFTE